MMDILASEVMRSAMVPAMLIAVVASNISVMVVAHRLSFLTVGISHATLVGLAAAVFLSLPIMACAIVAAVSVSVILAIMPRKRGLGEDAGTGILFAGSMALGILLVSFSGEYQVDLFSLLFGNILTVSDQDVLWIISVAILSMLSLGLAARTWWSIAFDAEAAEASGTPVVFYRILLYAIIGLTVVICVKLAGIVLTAGLLVLPAACAWFWGHGLAGLLLLSFIFSVTGTFIGMFASYQWDWPSGASVVLALCLMFVISWTTKWLTQK